MYGPKSTAEGPKPIRTFRALTRVMPGHVPSWSMGGHREPSARRGYGSRALALLVLTCEFGGENREQFAAVGSREEPRSPEPKFTTWQSSVLT